MKSYPPVTMMSSTFPLKKTKIVATLGPASSTPEVIEEMIQVGMDVARINFSHNTHEEAQKTIELLRTISQKVGKPIGIMGDLCGPRIRVGEMQNGKIDLITGQTTILTPQSIEGTSEKIPVSSVHLATDLEEGASLILDDGNLSLCVEKLLPKGEVLCRITRGGTLSSRRGINLPGRLVSLPALTPKDFRDIDFALAHDFDFLALSFIQKADDVSQLNRYLAKCNAEIAVIAKIEKKSAIEELDAILQETYGVMIARGDLALEMSIEEVPIAQKKVIAACRAAACPVITATQMLESMTENHKPTRAEAADIANAILDGTDAVMLSGESAVGKFPVQSVATMAKIAQRTEIALESGEVPLPPPLPRSDRLDPAVFRANYEVATDVGAAVMLVYTQGGEAVRWLVCHRPTMPVLALCPSEKMCRRLSLSWGVTHTQMSEPVTAMTEFISLALKAVQSTGLAKKGDRITLSTNSLVDQHRKHHIFQVEEVV